jgi:hypothetical protein
MRNKLQEVKRHLLSLKLLIDELEWYSRGREKHFFIYKQKIQF